MTRAEKSVKLSLVLDMDGTLVSHIAHGNSVDTYIPVARPYLFEFLCTCFEKFRCVGIWTAAEPRWYWRVSTIVLQPLLEEVSRSLGRPCFFSFVWSRDTCRIVRPGRTPADPPRLLTKPLKFIWERTYSPYCHFTADNTVVVDDMPQTFAENYANAVQVPKYEIGRNHQQAFRDCYLLQLSEHFEELDLHYQLHGSIRCAEKIKWNHLNYFSVCIQRQHENVHCRFGR